MPYSELIKLLKDRGEFYIVNSWRNHPAGSWYSFNRIEFTPENFDYYYDPDKVWIDFDKRKVYLLSGDFSNAHISPRKFLEEYEYYRRFYY